MINAMQHQDMSLVLSTDAKPRLRWTPELHRLFVHAVAQLGGADKATPKTLMRALAIPGLTLYHLKSHLQKHRLGKNQHSEEPCKDNNQVFEEEQSREAHCSREISDRTHNQIDESLQVAQALQMQMEVQRKLHEQIEVQRHLQLRIEAQGKYLQSVLKQAEVKLGGSNAIGVELAKTELSQLASMVDFGCPSSPISDLIGTTDSTILKKDIRKKSIRCGTGCSMESSLTSSESSESNMGVTHNSVRNSGFMEIQLGDHGPLWNSGKRKRSGSTVSDGSCGEELPPPLPPPPPPSKRSPFHKDKTENQLRMFGLSGMLDLNN